MSLPLGGNEYQKPSPSDGWLRDWGISRKNTSNASRMMAFDDNNLPVTPSATQPPVYDVPKVGQTTVAEFASILPWADPMSSRRFLGGSAAKIVDFSVKIVISGGQRKRAWMGPEQPNPALTCIRVPSTAPRPRASLGGMWSAEWIHPRNGRRIWPPCVCPAKSRPTAPWGSS